MSEPAGASDVDPTVSVSISFHSSVISSVRERVGKRGVSPYVEAAVRRQMERDNLAALIQANEDIHGPLTPEEIARARREMLGHTGHASPGEVA